LAGAAFGYAITDGRSGGDRMIKYGDENQRAVIERLGDSIKVPHSDEEAASRSVRAQVKELTNIDISNEVALWCERNRRAS
jgi:hypothetical protein